jgi:hypothetical protein
MSIVVTLLTYTEGAMHDSFDDGSFAIFDVATARIDEGPETGSEIEIIVDATDTDAVAVWNRVGGRVRAQLPEGRLAGRRSLPANAFVSVEVEP